MGSRKETILKYSTIISQITDITFSDKEFNYGKSIGRADNHYFMSENKMLILEIEASQRHPEMNVLKAWPYLKDNQKKEILLIQYITDTKAVSPNRIELCKWLGLEMTQSLSSRFKYYLITNSITTEDEKTINKLISEFRK